MTATLEAMLRISDLKISPFMSARFSYPFTFDSSSDVPTSSRRRKVDRSTSKQSNCTRQWYRGECKTDGIEANRQRRERLVRCKHLADEAAQGNHDGRSGSFESLSAG